jgi:hypothetical protein
MPKAKITRKKRTLRDPLPRTRKFAYIGYKKLRDGHIAKLGIPHRTPTYISYGANEIMRKHGIVRQHKCRTARAYVISITNQRNTKKYKSGSSLRPHFPGFMYITGEVVRPDNGKFDKKAGGACGIGIHFFLHRKSAIN